MQAIGDAFTRLAVPLLEARATGCTVLPRLTYGEYRELMAMLGELVRATQWWLADAANAGERLYGPALARSAHEAACVPRNVLRDLRYTARAVHEDRRARGIGLGQHRLLAMLSPAAQRQWLAYLLEHGEAGTDLTRAELRRILHANGVETA
jgi:GNAT superfamily N-acetyltransferase